MTSKSQKRRLDRIYEKLTGHTSTPASESAMFQRGLVWPILQNQLLISANKPTLHSDGDGSGSRDTGDPFHTQLHSLMRVVHWNVKRKARKARQQAKEEERNTPPKEEKREETSVVHEDQLKESPEMTRENTVAVRRGSLKARKMSLGPREQDRRRNSSLLSQALKEDVERLTKKFKFIIRFQLLVYRWWKRHSLTEVNSTHPFYKQFQMINDLSSENQSGSAIDFKASYFKANKQMKMSQEAQRILTMPPENRSKDEIYYAMIALRSIDSIADYPLRMQQALAKHGMFQSFGPKRIIVKQGHQPECFYFILFGTVVVATLEVGEPYAKTRVTLRRGENFGELAIAHRTARQSTVLTMESCELLTIDCDTYENIFMVGGVKTIHDPDHNKFMRSLFFLKDFPLEALSSNPKAMEFCYFRRNTVMVNDSNASEWIYIVKSGSLRVYKMLQKCYSKVNKRTGNYQVNAHTDGYHSFLNQKAEYTRYAKYHALDLPAPLGDSDSDEEDHHQGVKDCMEDKENLLSLPLLQRVERLIRPRTATGGVIATYGHSTTKRNIHTALGMSRDINKRTEISTPTPAVEISTEVKSTGLQSVSFDDNVGKRTLVDDFEASRKKEITAADLDPEFVLVQTLTKGQAFGIQQAFIEDQPSLILVSGGAECVMVNKKLYREQVDPNMAQQLKQQISPFPSDSDLQHSLQVRVNWMEFRKITLKKLMSEQRDGKPIQTLHKRKGKQAWH